MDPIIVFVIIAIAFVLLLLQWLKLADLSRKSADLRPILDTLHLLQSDRGLLDRMLRDETSHNRQEQARDFQSLRSEVMATLVAVGDSVAAKVSGFSQANDQRAEQLRAALELRLQSFGSDSGRRLEELVKIQGTHTDALSAALRDHAQQLRHDNGAVVARLAAMQAENEHKLEQMRQTVEEKLQGTLEARLGDSFRRVSERLEQVHSGLGEMRTLATGVGDLKRLLANVKTRGTWGEVQLGAIIEQILAPDQIGKDVVITASGEPVEYAVKLPGGGAAGHPVWLPIDAKFPVEDYLQLAEAAERSDAEGVERASRQLERSLRQAAQGMSEKHLAPPFTTDFGILFLPAEGLYAEVMRRPGFADGLQRDYRVVLAGPSTLAALLNALQMGFRTLAIQQRSSEVWEVLASVKTEFGKYAQVLSAVKKKLSQAQETIDQAESRTWELHRTLQEVKSEAGREESSPVLVSSFPEG